MHRIKIFSNFRKKSKYKNIPRDYNNIQYHSIKEAKYARDLDVRLKLGEILKWERQKKIELYAYGKHICNYYIDFIVYHNSGEIEYVEVKGFETDVWRLKWKLFEAQKQCEEPDAMLTIVR